MKHFPATAVNAILFCAACCVFCCAAAWAGPADLDVIVADGDDAPGTAGVYDLSGNFGGGIGTAIDRTGSVFFFGESRPLGQAIGGREGIWFGTGAFIDDVAVDGNRLSLFPTDRRQRSARPARLYIAVGGRALDDLFLTSP